MDRAEIHPSHEITQDWDVPDPHSPGWRCGKCRTYTCALCKRGDGMNDDDLAAPCPGIPWWDATIDR